MALRGLRAAEGPARSGGGLGRALRRWGSARSAGRVPPRPAEPGGRGPVAAGRMGVPCSAMPGTLRKSCLRWGRCEPTVSRAGSGTRRWHAPVFAARWRVGRGPGVGVLSVAVASRVGVERGTGALSRGGSLSLPGRVDVLHVVRIGPAAVARGRDLMEPWRRCSIGGWCARADAIAVVPGRIRLALRVPVGQCGGAGSLCGLPVGMPPWAGWR